MKTPTRFVQPLSAEQRAALKQIMQAHPSFRTRSRAHAVLLSEKRYSIAQLSGIFDVDRDTVATWLTRWEESGTDGLDDDPRPGRPTTLTTEEQETALKLAQEEPRAPHQQLGVIEQGTGKSIGRETLKRLMKKARLIWKRMRRSLRHRRDGEAFRAAQKELGDLRAKTLAGGCDLYY